MATVKEIFKSKPKPPAPVMPPLLNIRKDMYAIVRLSDNALMGTLHLGEHGAGSSKQQTLHCNPQLALELRNILEQETKGNVSLGIYGA